MRSSLYRVFRVPSLLRWVLGVVSGGGRRGWRKNLIKVAGAAPLVQVPPVGAPAALYARGFRHHRAALRAAVGHGAEVVAAFDLKSVGSALADGIVGMERRSFADDPVR